AERIAALGDAGWTLALRFEDLELLAPAPPPPSPIPVQEPELLEIVYTSGATAEPKGVMITHGNVLANLRPIDHEVRKYLRWARPLLPLRFVHLIPLSHLFGQVMGLLIPPLLDSAVVYLEAQSGEAIAAAVRQTRASVVVAVPRGVEIFSQWARRQIPDDAGDADAIVAAARGHGVLWRWWHWRRLHRKLGWKMWALVVGGAALPSQQEALWQALGYAVVQGYGLTETAPAVAITHPFKIRRGAVGRKLAGMDIRIAPDGEILVRGPNVSPGYFHNAAATAAAFSDGWLHTGDLGRTDTDGSLIYLGRKKEVIVTAEGMNIYPQDVEAALDAQPAIAESAVVADERGGRVRVHAVVAAPGADDTALAAAVAAANSRLEAHQRIAAHTRWPAASLPRTASTHKLQRAAIAAWLNRPATAAESAPLAANNVET
ncbi:MAG: AMP-binding protein, partial [Terriglobales bacterium]